MKVIDITFEMLMSYIFNPTIHHASSLRSLADENSLFAFRDLRVIFSALLHSAPCHRPGHTSQIQLLSQRQEFRA